MFSIYKENISIALTAIKGQLLRTILTVFIITIGITALVGILSLVGALENTISGDFASMGANTFTIQRYEFKTKHSRKRTKINPILSYKNATDFKNKYTFPFTKASISFYATRAAEVKYQNKKTDPEVSILGINENFLENTGATLTSGRNLTFFDIKHNTRNCILGADFLKTIFDDNDPINKTITIRGMKFKVIGLLESKGATFKNNQDLRVLIPLQLARSMYTLPNIDYNISIKVADKQFMEGAQDQAIALFRNIRGLRPQEINNFGIERSDDLLNKISDIVGYLYYAAWIISIITIFGSSIALMNIMLVSVTERTREIGIRKALGAKKITIASQFFIETLLIGQLGGILGIILGVTIGFVIATVAKFDFSTPWLAIVAATLISFIIAVISGSYPALKAAKEDPIESLRYE